MANDIKIGMTLDDGGSISNKTKDAKDLKQTLMQAGEAAKNIRVPVATSAARQGVAARAAAAQPSGGASDTNLSRGLGGATGAAGRDFAAQAQGLGGLVHVYATFAANLYAVSAAFGALSKAADTTNMVKGLDQLGAQSGRSLGSLAKQMAMVSDGALSMRDAISNTALASAAGMSNTNILRMTEVAKKASLALGRDMTDSMDRLTKGIAKVQPELLDELGIMARVIPAQEAYARQVGKTVSSLTDFEKRQAFANAVLDEGERKFNAIKIDANPYSKILASMTNIAQTGLELINKVFTPILNILSSSPTALTTAMVAVGAVLLKQAMPAIGYFKESIQQSADLAQKVANTRSIAAKAVQREELASVRKQADEIAEVKIAAVEKAEAKVKAISAATSFKPGKATKAIIEKSTYGPLDETDYAKLTSVAAGQRAKGNETIAKSYENLRDTIRSQYDSETKYNKLLDEHTAKLQEQVSWTKTAGQTQILADRANLAAATRNISSIAAQTASVNGFSAAWKEVRENVKKAQSGPQTSTIAVDTGKVDELGKKITQIETITTPKMGKIRGMWTLLTSGIGAATSALGTFISFAGPWLQVIGLITVALGYVSDYFTKNAHQVELFTKSLDAGTDAIKLATDVYTNFNNIPEGTALSSEALIARANAVTTLTDSIVDQVAKYKDVIANQGAWDKFTESFWGFFGMGAADKLATTVNKEIVKAFSLLNSDEARKAAMDSLSKVLQIDPNAGLEGVQKAVIKLGDSGALGVSTLEKLADKAKTLGTESKKTVNVLETLKSTTDNLTKANADYNNSLQVSSKENDFGLAIINNVFALGQALKDPITGITALNDLLKSANNLSMFTPKQAMELLQYKNDLNAISVAQQREIAMIPQIEETISKLNKTKAKSTVADATRRSNALANQSAFSTSNMPQQNRDTLGMVDTSAKLPDNSYQIKEMSNLLNRVREAKAINDKAAAEAIEKINGANGLIMNAFNKGMDLIDRGITSAYQKAAITIGQAKIAGLSGPGVGELENNLKQQDIKARESLIDATYENTVATIANSIAFEKYTAETEQGKLSKSDPKFAEKYAAFEKTIDQLTKAGSLISDVQTGVTSAKGLNAAIKGATNNQDFEFARALMPFKSAIANKTIQKIGTGAESQASNIAAEKIKASEQLAYEIKLNTLQTESNKLTQEKLGFQTQFSGLYSAEANTAMDKLDTDNLILKQNSAQLAITKEINDAEKYGNTELLNAKTTELIYLEEQWKLEKGILKIKQIGNAAIKQAAQGTLELKQKHELLDLQNQLSLAQINTDQARLSAADTLGQIDKEFLAKQQEKLGLQQQSIANTQALQGIEEARSAALEKVAGQKAADIEANGKISQQTLAEETRIKTLYDSKVVLQGSLNTLAQTNLGITAATAIEQAKLNDLLDKENSLAANLAKIFGDVGAALGETVKALNAAARSQDNLTKKKLQEINALEQDGPPDPKELAKIEEKYSNQSTKLQLDNIGDVAGATKKMFDEKSDGYKVLSGIQKAASIMSIAMQAKELATTIATSSAVITANIPAIFSSFMKFMGPFGPPAAALAIAAFLGAATGGSNTVDMTGKTAAERQTKQGTGTVSGDSEAKSQSINNSLQLLNATSVEGLSYSNKMVELLSGIKDGISGVAKGVYGVVGLRSGSQFGTKEGESGYNFLGGLFGSSSSKQITDSGLKITGSFADMIKGISSSIRTYEDVLTTSTSSFLWMSNTTQSLVQQLGDLDPKVQKSLQAVFTNAGDLMITAGKKLGMTSEQVMEKLATVDVSTLASLRGLKGQELDDALNSILSSMLDTASTALFASLQGYNKFGEGMLETTMRVIDGMDKVNLAMESVGRATVGVGLGGIALSDAMITASGGLDKFLDHTKSFADSFLTPTERLIPKQAALNKELNSLGFASNLTRDQFKQLVLGFQVTDDASAITYSKLLSLSDAMNEVTAAESIAADQEIKIYELLGNSSKALQLSREKELDSMEDSLKPRQKYIYALTDEIAIRDKLKAAYTSTNNALTASIKLLTDYKNTLLAGNASTLSPAEKYAQTKSLLIQTAAAAKVAISATSTTAEIAARDAAVAKLPSLIDSFTSASKDINASGAQYSADIATVTDILDSTTGVLANQQTDMQKQLGWLEDTADNTKTIAELLDTYLTAQGITSAAQVSAISSGSVAASTATPHANGGIASGWSLVGERGPELVNFTNPGRVYTNQASNDLFNNKELIAEIKALREEVCQLRDDQNKQTGAIIDTTIQSNAQNAQMIAAANANLANQQDWKTRSQVRVA